MAAKAYNSWRRPVSIGIITTFLKYVRISGNAWSNFNVSKESGNKASAKTLIEPMRIFAIVIFIGLSYLGQAQVTEINPSIKWRYVRTQELQLEPGRNYQFEFPAEEGYDYIFNFTHNKENVLVGMTVTDMQSMPIIQKMDSASTTGFDMGFRVTSNGTYQVVYGISGQQLVGTLPVTITLIRRVSID